MPAPTTAFDFLALVRRSGVADLKRLDELLPSLTTAEPLPLAEELVREGILTCFHAEQLLMGKSRGFAIGNYTVLERLGSGGMALVYLCEHRNTRQRVAVKVLPTAKSEDVAVLKRFYREARAGSALDHANIVRVHGISQDGSRHFLVMEYVEGTLLGSLVKHHGPLEVLRACHYMRQAAVGLQHIFESGLVHRDIKPDNLILDRSGTVKILDLGLARFCERLPDEKTVLTTGILGTPDYLAPEQSLDSHLVDIRADIYSLGGTFYFLLTGQPPFGEGTTSQKLQWHKTREPIPLRQLRPDVPETIASLIARMMAKNPIDRFQTPGAVANFLIPWTKTPIRPPTDAEMPGLCPAIGGSRLTEFTLTVTPIDVPTPSPTPPPTSKQIPDRDEKRPDDPPEAKAFTAADLLRGMDW